MNGSSSGEMKPAALIFLEEAETIAAYHHEKWDGSGYPYGLKGDGIPLSARIMAIADVFDALTTPRVYKKPWPIDEAFEHIRQQRGIHFDPDVVDAFEMEKDTIIHIKRSMEDIG
jgi:putative two-component system response regulator